MPENGAESLLRTTERSIVNTLYCSAEVGEDCLLLREEMKEQKSNQKIFDLPPTKVVVVYRRQSNLEYLLGTPGL